MTVDSEPVSLPWSEVAGVYFRRVPATSAPGRRPAGTGRMAVGARRRSRQHRLCRGSPHGRFRSGDHTGHALRRRLVDSTASSFANSWCREQGRRIIIDPAAHHLGDEFSTTAPLDPPQPEGGLLERTLELTDSSRRSLFCRHGCRPARRRKQPIPIFPQQIRDGELRTYLAINGKRIDYLNRYLKTNNLAPERIAIPVPAGLLHPGKNSIRLELTGMANEEKQLDDFGLLQMAVEFRSTTRLAPQPPHEPGHP